MTSCRGKKAMKKQDMHIASRRARNGKITKYRRSDPRSHVGNKYQFQFHGSGGAEVKQRKNESSMRAAAASHISSEVPNRVALHKRCNELNHTTDQV
jgi:hypothetical protein